MVVDRLSIGRVCSALSAELKGGLGLIDYDGRREMELANDVESSHAGQKGSEYATLLPYVDASI